MDRATIIGLTDVANVVRIFIREDLAEHWEVGFVEEGSVNRGSERFI